MNLLLDSHVLIWAAEDSSRLPDVASALMNDPSNELYVSAATIWELAIKNGLGKLPLKLPYRQWMDLIISEFGLNILPITLTHAERQSSLPWHHRDPFDRMLPAQSIVEGFKLVSEDKFLMPTVSVGSGMAIYHLPLP